MEREQERRFSEALQRAKSSTALVKPVTPTVEKAVEFSSIQRGLVQLALQETERRQQDDARRKQAEADRKVEELEAARRAFRANMRRRESMAIGDAVDPSALLMEEEQRKVAFQEAQRRRQADMAEAAARERQRVIDEKLEIERRIKEADERRIRLTRQAMLKLAEEEQQKRDAKKAEEERKKTERQALIEADQRRREEIFRRAQEQARIKAAQAEQARTEAFARKQDEVRKREEEVRAILEMQNKRRRELEAEESVSKAAHARRLAEVEVQMRRDIEARKAREADKRRKREDDAARLRNEEANRRSVEDHVLGRKRASDFAAQQAAERKAYDDQSIKKERLVEFEAGQRAQLQAFDEHAAQQQRDEDDARAHQAGDDAPALEADTSRAKQLQQKDAALAARAALDELVRKHKAEAAAKASQREVERHRELEAARDVARAPVMLREGSTTSIEPEGVAIPRSMSLLPDMPLPLRSASIAFSRASSEAMQAPGHTCLFPCTYSRLPQRSGGAASSLSGPRTTTPTSLPLHSHRLKSGWVPIALTRIADASQYLGSTPSPEALGVEVVAACNETIRACHRCMRRRAHCRAGHEQAYRCTDTGHLGIRMHVPAAECGRGLG